MKNRILAGILAFCMFFVLVPVSAIADLNPGDASLTVNGESTSITGFSFASAKKVKYGDNITFGINIGTGPYFYYLAEEEVDDPTELVGADWHAFSVDGSNKTVINLEPGNYYLGFSSTIDAVLTDFISGQFGFTVERATFSVPQNLEWDNGVVASWGAVLTTTTGGTIVTNNVDHYEVKLYKDSALVKTVTTAGTSYDFSADMATEGVYAFTVKAVPTSGASNPYYIESAVSGQIVNRIVKVTISFDRGIASVDPSTPFVVIVGLGDDEAYSIEAVVETGRTFGGWKCTETGVSFASATSESTYLLLSDNYSGATSITIYAWTVDDVLPVISYYGPASGNKAKTHLSASFTDLDEGVESYYIGTQANSALVTAWETVDDAAGETTNVEYALAAGGTYYLYVKDNAGNIATSVLHVTEMRYHDYCNNGAVADMTEYFISDVMETKYTILQPSRIGFALVGLYEDAGFNSKITDDTLPHNKTTGYDFYAQWLRKDITVSEEPTDLSITYDGAQHDLKVTVDNTEGTIAYQWYYNNAAIEGATTNIYKVKNVADSGEYYCKISLTVEGVTTYYQTEAVDVTISARTLTLMSNSLVIHYKDAAPTYTYKAFGFAQGETLNHIITGSLVCAYNPSNVTNGAVGSYPITFTGFSAANYKLQYQNGALTVRPYDVTKTDSTVTVTLPANVYPYVITPVTPTPAIEDDGVVIPAGYYTVTYENNVTVGTATVKVTFNGNYTGVIEEEFTIEKAEYSSEVSLSGWTFGDTPGTPSVSNNPEDGAVTYYYRLSTEDRASATTTQPVNAGSYIVYAVIAATDNYESYTTQDVAFSIGKKTIEITANSGTWEFDGFEHAAPDYTVNGTFVGSDSLRSVSITSTITNVGSVDNEIASYELSSSTLADNYNIVLTKGTLTVTTKMLTAPSNIGWDALGGTATWVHVTKDDLEVSYKIVLYRVDGTDHVFVAEYTTTNNYYDFTEDIKEDCANENSTFSYVFKIMTSPAGGTNKDNYSSSDYSDYSAEIYTVYVAFATVLGLDTYSINEASSAYLIAGESAEIAAEVLDGYQFNPTIWTMNSTALSFTDSKASSTTLTVPSNIGANIPGLILTVGIYNEAPVIEEFDATAASDNKSINFSIKASDSLGITGWIIKQASIVTLETAGWNYVSETEEFSTIASITGTGEYNLFVQDANGNIVRSSTSIKIYQIRFSAGTGASGSMDSLLKVQNKELVLPASTFTNPGKQFKTWAGQTGTYSDGGIYSPNQGDTLVAQWATANYTYTVNYYLMNTDGTYPDAPTSSRIIAASYNQVVANTDSELAQTYEGMSLDTSAECTSSITIDVTGKSINVYYKRNTYTITYKYRMPGASADTVVVHNYLFGAIIEPLTKPTAATGYGFIGWNCKETGSLPGTMPSNNLNASGTFGVYETRYIVNYFFENLAAGTGYTKNTALTESVPAFHSNTIRYSATDAPAVAGFTAAGVIMTQGAAGDTDPDSYESSASGKVDADSTKQLNVNVYYTRNSYDLTLYVWQGSRIAANQKYSHTWSVRYQAPITASDYTDYNEANWPHDGNYQLAGYSDWSTGLGAPETMPAGDVSVSRDFVSTTISWYEVEVYLEKATQGEYTLETTLLFYDNVGALVTIGGTNDYTVNYNNFGNAISHLGRYQYDSDNPNNVTSDTVTDASYGETPAKLKVYFERRSYTATYNFYSNDGTDGLYTLIGTITRTARWGSTYTINPVALFDSLSVAPANFTNVDATALAYDFRANQYMITMNNTRLDKAADLTTYIVTMPYYDTGNGVYYTKPDLDEQYYLNVKYRVSNTVVYSGQADRDIEINIGGTNYKVRIANKSMLFDATVTPSTDPIYDNYPGAQYRFGTWEYNSLKAGYTAQTYGSFTVYTTTDGYAYIADETNQFVRGAYAAYNYAGQAGYTVVTDFLSDYHANATTDDNALGLYIYNTVYYGIMYGNATLMVTYAYTTPWVITYMVGGVACSGHQHARNSQVKSVGCTHDLFSDNAGFTIGWYYDTNFTQPVSTPFTITNNLVLYGRYEKNTLINKEYIYYQLTKDVEIGGQNVDFITEDNVSAADIADKITSSSSTENVSFVNGAGRTVSLSVTTTQYFYDGVLVMICKDQPSLTFTNVSLSAADYLLTGFQYDDTQTGNTLITCAQSSPVSLRAYFVREKASLTFNPNNSYFDTETTEVYRYGAEIELPEPTKRGYTLDGYEFKIWDADQAKFVTWTGSDAPTSKNFNMPNADVYVKALFKTSAFDFTIYHFFADVKGSYSNTLLDETLAHTPIDVTAVLNGTEYEAGLYSNGVVSIEIGDFVYYFSTSTLEDSKYTVEEVDLFAATEETELVSEWNEGVGNHLSEDFDTNFEFFNCSYYYNMSTKIRTLGQSFKCYQDMEVTYYYNRATYTLSGEAQATDDGSVGETSFVGDGTYAFGSSVSMHVTVPEGYSFVGWFAADDLSDGYNSTLTALSTSATYDFVLLEDTEIVAVVLPDEITVPDSVIDSAASVGSGRASLVYGYTNGTANVLTMNVTMPEDDTDNTFISGYQWYSVSGGTRTKLTGATASTYRIPTGKNVGEYTYVCEVLLGNSKNGRTESVFSDDYVVEVTKKPITFKATAYSGNYDGTFRTFGLTVAKDAGVYTVYYSTTKLTSGNYSTGDTTKPSYRNVNVDGSGNAIPYEVYFYIHSTDGNHADASGSSTVLLRPRTVTISASGMRFSKIYDATTAVPGSFSDSTSKMYELTHSAYYTIQGLLPADSAAGYMIDGTAVFNSKDVDFANAVILSGLYVVDGEGDVVTNYKFSAGYSLNVSAYITPREIDTTWGTTTSFEYDAESHAPSITFEPDALMQADGLDVTVTGARSTVGTFLASTLISVDSSVEGARSSNYSVAVSNKSYTISKRAVTIKPDADTVVYDKASHTLTDFTFTSGTILTGSTYTVSANNSYTNAGTYEIYACNLKIYDENSIDVTDNYVITYASDSLTISPKPITIDGFVITSKVYDGTTIATIDASGAALTGVIDGDTVGFDATKVTTSFTAADVDDYTLSLSYGEGLLTGSSKNNYTFNATDSQTQADGSITKKQLTLKADDISITYGDETVAFDYTATGFMTGETKTLIGGTAAYKVRKQGTTDAWVDYSKTLAAGTYDVLIVPDALSADNYSLVANGTAYGTLTIGQRTLTIEANQSEALTKVYDGTTGVSQNIITGNLYKLTGIVNNDTVTLTAYTAAYASKNVADSITINVTGCTISNANYCLSSNAFTMDGKITKKALSITADPKSTTYGSAAPVFTYSTSGFVNGETVAVLGGSALFACDYDTSDAANRHAGLYEISVSGFTSDNYDITFNAGSLTVNKAVITVTAANGTRVFRGDAVTYTYSTSGFKYSDTDAVITGSGVASSTAATDSVVGSYPITVNVSGMSADNYTFSPAAGSLTITPAVLVISGIVIGDKVYDNSTSVLASQIDLSSVVYDGLLAMDEGHEGITLSNVAYASKNVGEDITVTFKINLNAYLAARYVITQDTSSATDSQSSTTSDITKRELKINLGTISLPYGTDTPDYSAWTHQTYSNIATGETLADTGWNHSAFVVSCDYANGTNDYVETYTVTTAETGLPIGDNYYYSITDGSVVITKRTLEAQAMTWSTTNLGTINWSASTSYGRVSTSYRLTIYKDGAVTTTVLTTSALTYDLASTLKGLGAGVYTVSLEAIADTLNNENYVNVASSTAKTSSAIYLTELEFVFDSDATTQAGKGASITVGGASSYIAIAGETGIALAATLKNSTGYYFKSVTTNNTNATASGSITEDAFSGTVSLAAANTSTSKITVTLALNAKAPTLNNILTGAPGSAQFSYRVSDRPVITATPKPVSGDSVGPTGYTYTYAWSLKSSAAGAYVLDTAQTTDTYLFPMGQNAYSNYRVQCVVTATRKDNGLSTSLTKVYTVVITRADLAPSLSLTNWTYGESHNSPVVTDNLGNGAVTYYYSTAKDDSQPWTTNVPTEAGVYYVKMVIAQTTNFDEYIMTSSMAEKFEIEKARLETPQNVALDDTKAVLSWDAVDGIKENAGVNSASEVTVSYRITMTKDGNPYKTYTTSGLSYKVAEDIDSVGEYALSVTAVSSNGGNALDSFPSTEEVKSTISATIEAADSSTTYTGNSFAKTYDNDAIVLSVTSVAAGSTLVWYHDGNVVVGATTTSLSVKNVADSGTYVVEITKDGVTHSTYCSVDISKKALTVTANDHTITYGDAYSSNDVSFDGFATGEDRTYLGGTLSITSTYTQFSKVDTYPLTPSGYTSANYTITYENGTLTVNKKDISVTVTTGQKKTYGQSDPTFAYTTDGLVNGDTLSGALARATGENVGTYAINVGTLANSNYNIKTFTGADFEIENADYKSFSLTLYGELIYNGKDQNPINSVTVITVNNQPYTIKYSLTNGGTYNESITLKDSGTYTIYFTVTAPNHNTKTGSFPATIKQKALTITANPKTITFGDAPANADVSYSGFENGETKAVLGGTLSYAYTYSQYGDVGSYKITPSGLTSSNYAITFADGTLTVNNAKLTDVSVAQTGTLTYTAVAQTATVSTTATSVHDTAVTFTYSTSATGTYTTTVPSFTTAGDHTVYYKASAANHDTESGSFTVKIGKKALTVTAEAKTIIYGDAPANAGVSYSGFEGTEDKAVLGGSLSYAYTYTQYGNIGTYVITPSGLTSSNYEIEFKTGVLTVNPRSITVTAEPKSKVYGTADAALTYTVGDLGLVNGDTLSGALSRATGETVGDYLISQNTLGVANTNYTITYTSANYTITNATLTKVTAKQKNTLTYSGLAQAAVPETTATAVNNLAVTFTYSATETGTYTTSMPTFTNAGSYTVYYKADAANHNTATGSFTVTIGKKALTITAKPKTITYGDQPSNDGVIIDGLVNGETEAVLGGLWNYSYNYIRYYNVGSYKITAPPLTSDNYDITFVKGDLTVVPKAITVTAKANQSKVYGQADPTFTYDAVGLVNGDTLTGALTRTAGETVGSYQIDQGTLANANYTITYTGNVFKITNADLQAVSVVQKNTLTYTAAEQTAEVTTAATAVKNQAVTFKYSATEDGTYTTTVPAFTTAGDHTVYYIASASNHNDYKGSFTVNIGQKTLTITANPKTITFGDAPINAGFTYSGLEGDEELADVVTGSIYYVYNYKQYGAVGSYTITPAGLSSSNYKVAFVPGVLTVQNATISDITVTQKATVIYSGVMQTINVDTSAVTVNNETYNFTYSATQAGTYGSMPQFTVAGTHRVYYKVNANNHNEASGYVDLVITKKDLTVTAKPKTITYGDAPANDGVDYSGFENGETSAVLGGSLVYTYTYSQYGNIGSYLIKVSGLTSDNYNIKFETGALTVNPKSITVTADELFKFYGQSDPTLTYEVTGLVNGDTLSGKLKRAEGETVDEYLISQNTLGIADTNYTITYTAGRYFSIIPVQVVVKSISAADLTYNEADQMPVPTASTITINDQTVTWVYSLNNVNFSENMPTVRNAGTHTIYYKASAENHADATGSFTVKVAARAITVTPNNNTITYGDAPSANSATISNMVAGSADLANLLAALSYSYTYSQYGAVGSYKISASGITDTNYSVTYAQGDLTVGVKTITVDAKFATKVYGQSDPTLTYDVDGLVNGDTLSGALTRVAGETVGDYDINIGTLANSNYTITYTGNKLSITNATLTNVTVTQTGTLTYSGLPQAALKDTTATAVNNMAVTFTFSATEDGTYTAEMPKFTNADSYDVYYKADAANHDTATGKFTVTIGKKDLTITANPKTITYGDAPSDNGVTFEGFVNGETLAVLTDNRSFAYSYTQNENVGEYTITPSGFSSDNYEISYENGTLTVVNAALKDIEITQKDQMTYTGVLQEILTNRAATAVNSQEITYKFSLEENGTYTTDNVSLLHAGVKTVYYIVSAPNHDDVKGSFTSTIAKAELTVTARDHSIIYGDTVTGCGVDFAGFLGTDTVDDLGGTLGYTSDFTRAQGVGTYVLTPCGYESNDYYFTYEDAVLTVDKRDLVVRANPSSIVFGEKGKGAGVVITGFASGENARNLGGALYYGFGNYSVGSKVGTYTLRPYGYTSDNYNITYLTSTMKVVKAQLSEISVEQEGDLIFNGEEQTPTLHTEGTAVLDSAITYRYALSQNSAYGTEIPTFVEDGEYTVYYCASAANHDDFLGSFMVKVLIAELPENPTVKDFDDITKVTKGLRIWLYDGVEKVEINDFYPNKEDEQALWGGVMNLHGFTATEKVEFNNVPFEDENPKFSLKPVARYEVVIKEGETAISDFEGEYWICILLPSNLRSEETLWAQVKTESGAEEYVEIKVDGHYGIFKVEEPGTYTIFKNRAVINLWPYIIAMTILNMIEWIVIGVNNKKRKKTEKKLKELKVNALSFPLATMLGILTIPEYGVEILIGLTLIFIISTICMIVSIKKRKRAEKEYKKITE